MNTGKLKKLGQDPGNRIAVIIDTGKEWYLSDGDTYQEVADDYEAISEVSTYQQMLDSINNYFRREGIPMAAVPYEGQSLLEGSRINDNSTSVFAGIL